MSLYEVSTCKTFIWCISRTQLAKGQQIFHQSDFPLFAYMKWLLNDMKTKAKIIFLGKTHSDWF